MDRAGVHSLVDEFIGAWNQRNLERFVGLLTEDVVWDDPAMLYGPAVGHEAVRSFCDMVLRAFPDFSYRIRAPICISESCDRCVVPWEITATHLGYFYPPGFAPTYQEITMQGVDVLELKNAKVCRIDSLFNIIPAIEQALCVKLTPKRRSFKEYTVTLLQRVRANWLKRRAKANK